jgi:hypothetical protein
MTGQWRFWGGRCQRGAAYLAIDESTQTIYDYARSERQSVLAEAAGKG